jgi:hypothetical protein
VAVFSIMMKLGSVQMQIHCKVVHLHYTAFTFTLHPLAQMFNGVPSTSMHF